MHIHAMDTVKNNQFSADSEPYIQKIEAASADISVIGITDYFRIEGYKTLIEAKKAGRMANIDLILPNIEFRLSLIPSKGNRPINIHLIISPDDPDHVGKIEASLSRLIFKADGEKYSCNEKDFIRLGKKVGAAKQIEKAYLFAGISKFCPSFEDFREWYKGERWLKENSIVVVCNNTSDGASGIPTESDLSELRYELYRLSDAIFSGNPKDRNYFLGKGVDDVPTLKRKIGGPKPCIHGSDAHILEKMFEPDEQRYCWIKADPTFEGLKQIIFEPEDRVFIGKTLPNDRYPDKVIKKITLNRSPNWYGLDKIELNPGYVAIIGNKGSGKTALADMISYAAQAWSPQDKSSFIKKADKEIADTEILLEWADGRTSKKIINIKEYKSEDVQVRYLSQQFVENLCSEDRLGNSLKLEIEKVVFSHIEETERLGASNFEELRKKKTTAALEQRQEAETKLSENILTYLGYSEQIASKSEKLQRKARLQNDIESIKKDIPKQDKAGEDLTKKITLIREKEAQLISEISGKKQTIESVKTEKLKIEKFETSLSENITKLKDSLKALGVPDQAIKTLPSFSKDAIEAELDIRVKELSENVLKLTGSADLIAEDKINEILQQKDGHKDLALNPIKQLIKALEKKETEDTEKRKKINKALKDIQELQSKIKLIDDEVKKIDEEVVKKKETTLKTILALYQQVFKTYEQEKIKLEALYAPLKDRLSSGADYEKRLAFYIQREVEHKAWCERGYAMFDSRKIKQTGLGTLEEFTEKVEEKLLEPWQANDAAKASLHLQQILTTLEKQDSLQELLKTAYNKKDVLQWLFSTAHIKMMYGMKYDGVTLNKLSPGTKGVILLMLYLEMDKADNRPLIVDQPEENLDNESVFNILTRYFREAKKRRQIIVITHNPNLVVNTDADQIIVASSHEDEDLDVRPISYASGSIENTYPQGHAKYPGIRELACNILEGGEEAFAKRDKRYATKTLRLVSQEEADSPTSEDLESANDDGALAKAAS